MIAEFSKRNFFFSTIHNQSKILRVESSLFLGSQSAQRLSQVFNSKNGTQANKTDWDHKKMVYSPKPLKSSLSSLKLPVLVWRSALINLNDTLHPARMRRQHPVLRNERKLILSERCKTSPYRLARVLQRCNYDPWKLRIRTLTTPPRVYSSGFHRAINLKEENSLVKASETSSNKNLYYHSFFKTFVRLLARFFFHFQRVEYRSRAWS